MCSVSDVDFAALPPPNEVNGWSSQQHVNALCHDRKCADYNTSFRQLQHVRYGVAVQLRKRYLDTLGDCEPSTARNVTENLYERHLKPISLGSCFLLQGANRKSRKD